MDASLTFEAAMQPQIETVGLCLVDHLLLGYDLLKIVIKKGR